MIENEKQLNLTREWIARFEVALENLEQSPDTDLPPVIIQAQKDAVSSEIERMEQEVIEFTRGMP